MYHLTGEAARYQTKVLATDSTLLAGLLIVRVCSRLYIPLISNQTTPYYSYVNAIIGQMFYGYGEHVLVKIIAYNSKK